MPYFSTAANVSPPPAMEKPDDDATASATIRVPSPKWSRSNTPRGPFQRIVAAFLRMLAKHRADSGPMSRIISLAATSLAGRNCAWGASGDGAVMTSTGSGTSTFPAILWATGGEFRLGERRANLPPRRQQEGVGDAAADDEGVGEFGHGLEAPRVWWRPCCRQRWPPTASPDRLERAARHRVPPPAMAPHMPPARTLPRHASRRGPDARWRRRP